MGRAFVVRNGVDRILRKQSEYIIHMYEMDLENTQLKI